MIERYQDAEIARIWSPEHVRQTWARVEMAVAAVAADQRIYPADGANIHRQLFVDEPEALALKEQETRHDFVAFLEVWRAQMEWAHNPEAARWLHWGLTSSDVIDTALALNLSGTTDLLLDLAGRLCYLLDRQADRFAKTVRLGRTHGRGAEPTTLGLRFATWSDALRRIEARLVQAADDACRVKLSGPVGTYSHLPPSVEQEVAFRLALKPAGPASQVYMRDSLASWSHAAAQLVGLCEAIALEFRLAAQTGIDEVSWQQEAGSSVMPHKSNPATAETICGLARLARGLEASLQPFALWGDRDLTHSSVERVALVDLAHLAAHAIERTYRMVDTACWSVAQMHDNLEATGDDPYRAAWTLDWIRLGKSVREARELALDGQEPSTRSIPSLLKYVAGVIAGRTRKT